MSTSISLYELLNNVIIGLALIILCLPINFNIDNEWWLFLIAYGIGAFYSKLNEMSIGVLFRNFGKLIKEVEMRKNKEPIYSYYQAYYKGWKTYCQNNVISLEALLAFVRNIWPIIIAYLIAIFFHNCNWFRLSEYEDISLMPIILLFSILIVTALVLTTSIYLEKIEKKVKCIVSLKSFRTCLIAIDSALVCIILLLTLRPQIEVYIYSHIEKFIPISDSIFAINTRHLIRFLLLLLLFLPQLGYYLQIKIYELVFEYEKYNK